MTRFSPSSPRQACAIRPGRDPVGDAWGTSAADVQCGDFFGAATLLAHGADLREGAPWPAIPDLARKPDCLSLRRVDLAPKANTGSSPLAQAAEGPASRSASVFPHLPAPPSLRGPGLRRLRARLRGTMRWRGQQSRRGGLTPVATKRSSLSFHSRGPH